MISSIQGISIRVTRYVVREKPRFFFKFENLLMLFIINFWVSDKIAVKYKIFILLSIISIKL